MFARIQMPNSYHYFESGEVSQERLDLEIELLKQLQEANLLKNLNWNEYDTSALRLFHQAGIREVSKELIQRYGDQPKECEQNDFIEQCIRKHRLSPIKENFKQQRISFPLILNILFIFICLSSVLGLFIYQYIKFNHQHHFTESLDRPLTTKRRHLSFTDDLSVILLTFTSVLILSSSIIATRVFGIFAFAIIIALLIFKVHQVITLLSEYRELQWPKLYNYMYS
jgi:hypothetical protein